MLDFDGFDWDAGNWPKCGKHGVERDEIEAAFRSASVRIFRVKAGSEGRWMLVAFNRARWINVVYTWRGQLIRPISARHMHAREALRYVT